MDENTIQLFDLECVDDTQIIKYRYDAAMISDVGTSRSVNQDACEFRISNVSGHSLALAIVCDGMGGYEKGEYSSQSTVEFFIRWFEEDLTKYAQDRTWYEIYIHIKNSLTNLILEQNDNIRKFAIENNIKTGTTLSLLVLIEDRYIIAQIGDSRVYRIHERVEQLTEDQSLVAAEVRAGRLTLEEAKKDKRRNIILQCMGAMNDIIPAYYEGQIRIGDLFLICSDGFVHETDENEIYEKCGNSFERTYDEMEAGIQDIVDCIKLRGEKDNITVLALRVMQDL